MEDNFQLTETKLKLRMFLMIKIRTLHGYKFECKHQVNVIIPRDEWFKLIIMVYEMMSNHYAVYTNGDIADFLDVLLPLVKSVVIAVNQDEANFLNSDAYRNLRDYVQLMYNEGAFPFVVSQ